MSPPEKQRTALDSAALGSFVRMSQINAERHIVSGVYELEADAWRWCAGRAVLRVQLGPVENLKFAMKYAVPAQVIAAAKTVRLRIFLNDKLWEEMRYEKDGIFEIDKPAPVSFLKPNSENRIAIEVDKPLPADSNQREMGFILVHVGFQPS